MVCFVEGCGGAIICFFFTLLYKLRPTVRNKKIKNVLVIELVEMGASIMAYSSLRYIQKNIDGANIYCLCLESTKEPWLLLDAIPKENVYAIDNSSPLAFGWSVLKQARALSKKNIDIIIDYELFTRISAIISFLIRTKFRAGFYRYTMEGLYRGDFYDVKCYFNQNMHIAKNLLAVTKSAVELSTRYYNYEGPIHTDEIVAPSYQADPAVSESVRNNIRLSLVEDSRQPLILVAPTVGSKLSMRDYPKEHYVEVIKNLLNLYPKHAIVLIGTMSHAPVCEYIREKIGNRRCINFAGHTPTLRELVELLGMGELLITNDGGTSHFASMTDIKSLVLFGPETPFMYGPLGKTVCLYEFFHSSPSITSYNHKNPPSDYNACLRNIHPDRVVAMAQLLLEEKANYRTINNEIPYLL